MLLLSSDPVCGQSQPTVDFENDLQPIFTRFGCTVALALTAQVISSTVVGALLPIGARAIRLDPAAVSAPAITTLVDVSGMVIYFTIAQALLHL